VEFEDPEPAVTARLAGYSARATFGGETGCTLGAEFLPTTQPRRKTGIAVAEVAQPSSLALSAVLDRAFEEPPVGGRNTLAVLVQQRGELVAERYRHPAHAGTPLQGWSMNKSLMATWIGIRAAQGGLSLQQKVVSVLAQPAPELIAKLDSGLDLGHLLHMESGLDFREDYFPGDEVTYMLYRSKAMWRVAPAQGHAYAPGQHFRYSSGDTNLAAFLWQRSLGDTPYSQWIEENFAAPLGITSLVAEADASGIQVGSSYTYMTARDWARVGQLWLDAWHGRSSLLSSDWQRAAVTPRRAAQGSSYGRGFWLNRDSPVFADLPRKVFYADGYSGQYVVVMPEQELVVVRLGLTLGDSDTGLEELLLGAYRYAVSNMIH